jgi:hypothetical protein
MARVHCQLGESRFPMLTADQPPANGACAGCNFHRNIAGFTPTVNRHYHCIGQFRNMSRFNPRLLLVAVIAVTAMARPSLADTGTGSTTGTPLSASDLPLYVESYDKDQKAWVQMNATTQQFFFNRARCECAADETDWTGSFKVAVLPSTTAANKIQSLLATNLVSTGSARLYAGNNGANCLQVSGTALGNNLSSYCLNLLDPTQWATGIQGGMTSFEGRVWESSPIPVSWLVNAAQIPVCSSPESCNDTNKCASASVTQNIYLWAQTSSGTAPDSGLDSLSISVSLVGAVAYTPANIKVEGGNNALKVKWGWAGGLNPSSASGAFLGVQLFCRRAGQYQVFKDKSFTPAYKTSAMLCPGHAPASTANLAFDQMNPSFLCSDLIPSTSSEYRITGLQNGISYDVGVAAIDRYGNVSPITDADVVPGTPIPTVDFYSAYRSDDGAATGGFCTIAKTHRKQSAALMLGLVGLGMLLARRRRASKGGPRAGVMLVLFAVTAAASGKAHAAPYVFGSSSFTDEPESEPWHGTKRQFAIEARFGLYTPNVDSEFGGKASPNQLIFGSKRRPMWQLEFDWEVLKVFGTLAVGGSVGYYKENGLACDQRMSDLKASPPNCVRSGDNTALRLIPFAALVIYRLDVAAELWKIPLVPYAKAGLNYTIWTVTDGDGNIPSDERGGRGQGGTAGWQAAVGISLQLDFFDPGAARGFDADVGVNHTYAFFEMTHVNGSGLYRKDVLRVGDSTWFTGLMFEF